MQSVEELAPTLSPGDVIARTRELIPRLRERIDETEKLRRLPDATIREAREAGIFSLLLPASLGGSAGGLKDFVQVLRYLAQGDPTVAWTVGFLTEHNWMLARYPKPAQDDVFAGGAPVFMAAVANPPQRAEPVSDGYILTGRWGYASGVMHSEWLQATALIDGEDRPSLFLVPIDEVDIQDTWYMSGMKGSGSNDVKVDGQFVPEHRSVNIDLWHSRRNHGGELHPEAIYRYDARDLLVFIVPALMVGAAEAMLEIYRNRLDHRRGAYSQEITGDTVLGQTRYARSLSALRTAQALLGSAQEEIIAANAASSDELSDQLRALSKLDCLSICDLAWSSMEFGVRGSGAAIFRTADITQHFIRDMQTLRAHITVDQDGMQSKAGEILLDRASDHDPARNFT